MDKKRSSQPTIKRIKTDALCNNNGGCVLQIYLFLSGKLSILNRHNLKKYYTGKVLKAKMDNKFLKFEYYKFCQVG